MTHLGIDPASRRAGRGGRARRRGRLAVPSSTSGARARVRAAPRRRRAGSGDTAGLEPRGGRRRDRTRAAYVVVDERLPDRGARHLRGRRRHRLPGARVDLDGAGARRRVPRVRLRLQARGVAGCCPYGIYTIPEVSCVGLGEEDAAGTRGSTSSSAAPSTSDNARGQIIGDRDGHGEAGLRRASRKLLGCHCIGERASELVHIGQVAIALGGTVDTFIEMVFNYPTLGETLQVRGLRRARQDGSGRLAAPFIGPPIRPPTGPRGRPARVVTVASEGGTMETFTAPGPGTVVAAPEPRHPGHREGAATMVLLEDVTRRYVVGDDEVVALDGVDLEVDEGEFVVVLGPSGSGKTTLLNLIGALDTPTSGTVTVAGRRITGAKRGELFGFRRSTVSFIFQSFNLFPGLTAVENVRFGADVAGADVDLAAGARGRRAGGAGRPLPARAVRRRAAARRDRAGARHGQPDPAGRRADRRARLPHRGSDPRAAAAPGARRA